MAIPAGQTEQFVLTFNHLYSCIAGVRNGDYIGDTYSVAAEVGYIIAYSSNSSPGQNLNCCIIGE